MSTSKLTVDETRYIELVADYCLFAGVRHPEAIVSGGEFSRYGTYFRLVHIPETRSGMVCVWCDFGKIPEGQKAACYLDMLKTNTLRYDGVSPVMALCPQTGIVVCSARLPLEHMTAAALDDFICFLAKEAAVWRKRMWEHASYSNAREPLIV